MRFGRPRIWIGDNQNQPELRPFYEMFLILPEIRSLQPETRLF